MGEKFRKMERTPWNRIEDRDYAWCDCPEYGGVASLIHIINVKQPSYRVYDDGEPVAIIKSDSYWLQIAPKNEHWWLTAMLDENGRFVHAYFDMTDENHIDGGKSWFCDMYLDVVIKKNGAFFILDEDELMAAYNIGEITKKQYDEAHACADDIILRYASGGIIKIANICDKYFKKLSPALGNHTVHKMHLEREPFDMIKTGRKNVELRLFDEKRRRICVGDVIEFECHGEILSAKVIDLWQSESFEKLFSEFPCDKMGFDSTDNIHDMAESMRNYYSLENEQKYGVLGIKLLI